ncbi:hypothetical protein [Ectobacillus antri]|uniref:hypothetical protein n=1 Tax=Ectobacillus antri TaxID=2486280 RepID=UPI000F5B6599|nr:hypothetical protein [Ectobacillus antri]
MIENGMLIGNAHDSCTKDFDEYCSICDGELYYGMKYYQLGAIFVCEKCENRVLEIALVRVAGE